MKPKNVRKYGKVRKHTTIPNQKNRTGSKLIRGSIWKIENCPTKPAKLPQKQKALYIIYINIYYKKIRPSFKGLKYYIEICIAY